ncbi:MAG: hypothetical protein N4A74_25995 [Carboxylicivirga sp.]|jgi:hypothetical protein|nr:hypothetical protein [Carboxylicivirga sp.]
MEFKDGDIVKANGLAGEYIFQGYLEEDLNMIVSQGENKGKKELIANKGQAILKLKDSDKTPDFCHKNQLKKVE